MSALASVFGLIMMKLAFRKIEMIPEAQRQSLCGLPMNRTWWLGFVTLVLLPLPLDFVALGLASASIIFPVGTVVMVLCSQLLAPKILDGEKMRRRDWIASAIVCTGCGLTVGFGDHTARSYNGTEILSLYGQTSFLVSISLQSIVCIVCLVIIHVPNKLGYPYHFFSGFYVPGFCCALQTISFKSMSELTTNVAFSEGNEWSTFPPWLFVMIVLVTATAQLVYMNKGSAQFKATVYMPTYNACLMVLVVWNGAIFFQEWQSLHPVVFPIGVTLIVVGIAILAWDDPTDTNKVYPESLDDGVEVHDAATLPDSETAPVKDVDAKEENPDDVHAPTIPSPTNLRTETAVGFRAGPAVEKREDAGDYITSELDSAVGEGLFDYDFENVSGKTQSKESSLSGIRLPPLHAEPPEV